MCCGIIAASLRNAIFMILTSLNVQAAVDAKLMEPVWEIGREQEVQVIDSSLLCE